MPTNQQIMPDFIPDEEIHKYESPQITPVKSTGSKLGGFSYGLLEALAPTNIPSSLETFARATPKLLSPSTYNQGILHGIGQSFQEAKEKTILPDIGEQAAFVRSIPQTIAGQGNLTKNYENEVAQQREFENKDINQPSRLFGGLLSLVIPTGAMGVPKVLTSLSEESKAASLGSKASQLSNQTRKLGAELGANSDLIENLLKNPDQISSLYQNMPENAKGDLGLQIAESLKKIKNNAGEIIGNFKKNISLKNDKNIDPSPYLEKLNNEIDNAKVNDISMLQPKDSGFINKTKAMMSKPLSGNDELKIVHYIDENTKYDQIKNGVISQSAANVLTELRNNLKESIRGMSGEGEKWATADDVYSKIKNNADDLINTFEGDNRIRAVNTLLNEATDPKRQRLVESLSLARNIGLNITPADEFFKQINNIRTAQGLRAIKEQVNDPLADKQFRFISSMKDKYQSKGGNIGIGVGGLLSAVTRLHSTSVPLVGAEITMPLLAKGIGERIGANYGLNKALSMANPQNLIDMAKQSKELSGEAQNILKSISIIKDKYGSEGMQAALKMLGPIPPVNEIENFINTKSQMENNNNGIH